MKTLQEALFSKKNILNDPNSKTFIITNTYVKHNIQQLTVFYDNSWKLFNFQINTDNEIGNFRLSKGLVKDFCSNLDENKLAEYTENTSGKLNFMYISVGVFTPKSIIIEGRYRGRSVSVEYEFKNFQQTNELINFLRKF